MARDEKFEVLKAEGKLPSPKGVAMHVIQLSQKDNVSNQEIAEAIKADPVLSGRVIKIANMVATYHTRPIASVVDAVTVLGLNALRQLLLSLSLVEGNRDGVCKNFNYQEFWAHSLLTAIAAQHLGLLGKIGSNEEVFILGLLGNVGRLAFASSRPDEYSSMLEKTAGTDSGLAELELAEFGLTHNQLSGALLAEWGLPVLFQKVAVNHEVPEKAEFADNSREDRLLNLLHVSNYLASLCLSQDPLQRKMVYKLMMLASRLGVDANTIIELGDKVVKELSEWSKLFGLNVGRVYSITELLDEVPLTSDLIDAGSLPRLPKDFYKLRVLVVDDDRVILLMLQNWLEQDGHIVTTARNGVEALLAVEESMPQLILTDWVMPEMDGIEFCRALRRNIAWRNIYVFIVTGLESNDRLVDAFEAGADDYLTKPINFKVLGARLRAGQRVVQLQEELEFDRQQLSQFAAELAASNQRLQQLALTDVLTELPNRRNANEQLDRQWAIAERSGRPLSCMMIDIDYFKNINDTHGHKVGDDVLKQVANILRSTARKQDMVCRLGGEEFLVICPDSDPEQAFQYAERLRQSIAAGNMNSAGVDIRLTVSIGLANKKPELSNVEMLLQLADKRLYAAKNKGRNQTVAD